MGDWLSTIYDKWYIINLPTILIVLLFALYLIRGAIRGSRKGTILLIHMAIAMSLSAVLFFVMTSKFSDGQLITFINSFIPGTTIQEMIHIDVSCDTIEKIIISLVQNNSANNYEEVLSSIMPYLSVIVEMVFRLCVFIICIVFYWVIKFVLYVFYFIFYPQRRYKRRIENTYQTGMGLPYEKHAFSGMMIGMVRGIVCLGLFCSFFGSFFYIVSNGVQSPDDYEEIPEGATDEEIQIIKATNFYYMIRNYGNSGLFGVLNGVRNSEDIPYYLFFANSIMKGKLSVDNPDIDGDYYLITELADYAAIVNQCVDLGVKYDLLTILNDKTVDPLSIFQNKEICDELNSIIDQFKTPEFTKALVVGLVKTITDDYETYLNAFIKPGTENGDMMMDIVTTIFQGDEGLDLTKLVKENDVRLILKASVSVLNIYADYTVGEETTEGQMEMVGTLMEEIVPYFQQLSFLSSEDSKQEFNNLMYKATSCAAKYVVISMDGQETTLDEYMDFDDIDWSVELVTFLNVGSDMMTMVSKNNINFNDSTSILNLFDSQNEQYDNNMEVLGSVSKILGESKLLSSLFESEISYKFMEKAISTSLMVDISIPRDVSWGNTTSSTGEKVDGELINLISLFTCLVDNGLMEAFNSTGGQDFDITKLVEVLAIDEVYEKINASKLTYYILSEVILKIQIDGVSLYLPDEIIDIVTIKDIEYSLLKKAEISSILHGLSAILPVIQATTGEGGFDIAALLQNQALVDLINDSTIIGGTVVYLLIDNLEKTGVTINIPEELDVYGNPNNMNNWLGNGKELNKLTDILVQVAEVSVILNNQQFDTSLFTNMVDESFKLILESSIIYYNACSLITSSLSDIGMDIIVPMKVYEENSTVFIKKSELLALKHCFGAFVDENNSFNIDNVLQNSSVALESDILHATMIYYIANNLQNQIILPAKYMENSTKEKLTVNFEDNYWYTTEEILHVFNAINALSISFQNFEFSQEKLMEIIDGLNEEKLNIILNSNIIWLTFGKQLELTEGIISIPTVACETIEKDTYILKSELKSLVFSLQLFSSDLDLNNFDISVIKGLISNLEENVETVYSSKILTFTLTNEIIKLSDRDGNTGVLSIPEKTLTNLSETEQIVTKNELKNLLVALDAFGDQDISKIDASFITTLTVEQADKLLASDIIHYTLSSIIIDLDESKTISIPTTVKENIAMTPSVEEVAITIVELKKMILAVQALGITDFSAIDANIITTIEDDNIPDLVASDILRYTISVKLFEIETIIVPESAVMSFGQSNTEIALTTNELENIVRGIKALNITDFGAINANIIISLTEADIETILLSDILQYTISKTMFDLNNVIDIPTIAKQGSPETLEALTKMEMKNLILGVQALNIEAFEAGALTANSFLSLTEAQIQTICQSYVLHYTISQKMLAVGAVKVPSTAIGLLSNDIENEKVILTSQIVNLVNAIQVLQINDLMNVDVNKLINLSETQIDVILLSSILHYTLSTTIIGISELSIPEATKSYLDVVGQRDSIIVAEESKKFLQSMASLNMNEIGSINANDLMAGNLNLDIILDSSILRFTVSRKISQLNYLNIPQGVYTMFDPNYPIDLAITKDELITMVAGLSVLGGDLGGADFSIASMNANSLETILTSKILHYTISEKIVDLATTFTIPNVVYGKLIGGYDEAAITALEIKSLVSNLNTLNISLTGNAEFTSNSVNEEVFAANTETSKILIATVSKVISTNFAILSVSRDIDMQTDMFNSEIVTIKKEEIYSILVEFKSINLDIASGTVEIQTILNAISSGSLNIVECSNTTYLLASILLSSNQTLPLFDNAEIEYYAKNTIETTTSQLLTRTGIAAFTQLP